MASDGEDTFWVLEEQDVFIARKVSGRNLRFGRRKAKANPETKRAVNPFRLAEANMANKNYDSYDQA